MRDAEKSKWQWRNDTESYGAVAKFFHWLIALLIAGMLILGFVMEELEKGPKLFYWYGLHKELGILVLLLVVLRLGWKVLNVAPLLPDRMEKITILAAKTGHGLLYAVMFAMPITGWAMSSASGFPVSFFGLFVLPDFVQPDRELKHGLEQIHANLAWVLMGLVALHIVAALLHHFYYKDNILRRMLPLS